jgi:predicted nucleotidyltransferase component of viral defense system
VKLDRDELTRLAAEHGFQVPALEKVIRLGDLLAEFSRNPLLRDGLLLKGGSALNLCFGALRRLSVNLDFNYARAEGRDEMLADRPEVERAIYRIADTRAYQVQASADEHAGRKLFLRYQAASGTPDRIEVDVNYLHRVPLATPIEKTCWQPGQYPAPQARLVGMEELAVGKLCALLDRVAPRDLYDAVGLPELARQVWAAPRFRGVFMALAGTLPHPVYSYTAVPLDRVSDAAIREQLYPMLRGGEALPSPAALRQGAWAVVEPFLRLTDREREFTDRLQVGELRAELLFPDDEQTARRVSRHPGLLWKVQNAVKPRSRNR